MQQHELGIGLVAPSADVVAQPANLDDVRLAGFHLAELSTSRTNEPQRRRGRRENQELRIEMHWQFSAHPSRGIVKNLRGSAWQFYSCPIKGSTSRRLRIVSHETIASAAP